MVHSGHKSEHYGPSTTTAPNVPSSHSPHPPLPAPLPSGTSAPNTLVTEYAVSKYHLQPSPTAWLIQAPAPLTATQISREPAVIARQPLD
jgi:hypothetical protein